MLGQLWVGHACAQGAQGVQQIFARVGAVHRHGDGRPVGVVGASGGQAAGQIGQIQVGIVHQVLVQSVGLRAQRCGGARGDRPQG